jgi:hypothetical protein
LFLDKKERRLGDLAAATIVVKEQRNPFTVYEISQAARQSDLGGLDVKRLGLADYEALLAYLKRRHEIEQFFRSRIAKSLVDHLRRKLDVDAMLVEQSTPEIFLEKVYLAYSKYRKQQDENQENQENQDFPDSEE